MDNVNLIQGYILQYFFLGVIVGFIGRWILLRGDIRQYPSIPNGYLIHLATGFVAAAIGAIAFPALLNKNYVAATFLAMAIQQFREIRKTEKSTLISLDKENYFPRGDSYIDGIAKTFEARNYIVMITALVTTTSAFHLRCHTTNEFIVFSVASIIGFAVLFILKQATIGHTLQDIVEIEDAKLSIRENHNLYVGDIYVMNIGLDTTRERILKNGIGVILKSKHNNPYHKVILNHIGQRKAIMHECARILGLERYITTRRNFDTGELALMIVPIIKDREKLKDIILHVPILEMNKLPKKENL